MSLKPEVVRVSGVHSVTNSSQGGDIGFPQLQLEKLFEAATVKELAQGEPYNDKKKYAYLNPNWPETDPNKYLSIENKAHFYCVRDGYCSLDGIADHYYTKEGDDYKYNAVPPTGSWDAKLEFSDAIKDKELYSISQEEERIYIEGQGYYKKENDGYKRQGDTVYDTFKKSGAVDWSESNKYKCIIDPIIDEEGNVSGSIKKWKNGDNLANNGYYLYIKPTDFDTYIVQLHNITFSEEGIWESNTAASTGNLYKLCDDEDYIYSDIYIKNGTKLNKLPFNTETIFTTDPTASAADNSIYAWNYSWQYPNNFPPEDGTLLLTDQHDQNDDGSYSKWRSFDQADFPLFTEVALIKIPQVTNDPYTVYEKLAVTVNYKYSGNNNLKFIFTNKDVDDVLAACNLKSTLPSKYVHLTNLEYATDMA